MDIKNLEAFLALADHLNFTKSAEQLYISQPAFSRQITRLEDEFDCELFSRSKRKVELTEYGRQFAEHAQNIYNEYEKWMVQLKQMKSKKSGQLRIGFLRDLPHAMFPRAVRAFEEASPDVEITLSDGTMSDIIDGLLRGTIDAGFSLSNNINEYEDIETLAVAPVSMCAALPAGHPLAGQPRVNVGDLREESFVMISPDGYGPGSRHIFYLCKQAGFEPNIAAYTSFVPSLLMMVECGVGVTLVAETARSIAPPGVTLVPLQEDIPFINMQLLWKNTAQNPIVEAFVASTKALVAGEA